MSLFHSQYPYSIHSVPIPFTVSLFHSQYPYSIHSIPIPFTISLFHSQYPYSIHSVPIPFIVSLFHSQYPYSIHSIPIPFTVSLFHSQYPYSILFHSTVKKTICSSCGLDRCHDADPSPTSVLLQCCNPLCAAGCYGGTPDTCYVRIHPLQF